MNQFTQLDGLDGDPPAETLLPYHVAQSMMSLTKRREIPTLTHSE